jgi:hypothetical protein
MSNIFELLDILIIYKLNVDIVLSLRDVIMKKILIGENHSNSIARDLILKLISKIGQRKIKFLIEFEPNDYQKFEKDVKANKVKDPNFKSLVEIIGKAQSNNNITIIPIDIPWKLLLEGIQNIIKTKEANTSDVLLNKLLEKSWDDAYSVKAVVEQFIPHFEQNNEDLETLDELLKSIKLDDIFSKLNGDIREEFYKKRPIQRLRDNYFIAKINNIDEKNEEFLIILVGGLHTPALDGVMKDSKNYYFVNQPTENKIDSCINEVLASETSENRTAPVNAAPNFSFHKPSSDNSQSLQKPAAATLSTVSVLPTHPPKP